MSSCRLRYSASYSTSCRLKRSSSLHRQVDAISGASGRLVSSVGGCPKARREADRGLSSATIRVTVLAMVLGAGRRGVASVLSGSDPARLPPAETHLLLAGL